MKMYLPINQRCAKFNLVLAFILCSFFPITFAQAQVPLVIKAGKWIVSALAGYSLGKGIDKFAGASILEDLQQLEKKLEADISRGNGDQIKLRSEINAVQTEVKILKTLLQDRPTRNEIEALQQQLNKELNAFKLVQVEHSQRIAALEEKVAELTEKLDRRERDTTDSEGVLDLSITTREVTKYEPEVDLDLSGGESEGWESNDPEFLEELNRELVKVNKRIKDRPNNPHDLIFRGLIYHLLGKESLALSDYNTVIRLYPENDQGYFRRGHVYYMLDRNEEALTDYNKSIRIAPRNPRLYFERSKVYEAMGNKRKAISDLETFLAFNETKDPEMVLEAKQKIEELNGPDIEL